MNADSRFECPDRRLIPFRPLADEFDSEIPDSDDVTGTEFPLVDFRSVEGRSVAAVQILEMESIRRFDDHGMFVRCEGIIETDIAAEIAAEDRFCLVDLDIQAGKASGRYGQCCIIPVTSPVGNAETAASI